MRQKLYKSKSRTHFYIKVEKGNIIIEIKEIRNQRLVQKGEAHMIDKIIENNRVSIVGEIVSEFRYSHEVLEKDSTW